MDNIYQFPVKLHFKYNKRESVNMETLKLKNISRMSKKGEYLPVIVQVFSNNADMEYVYDKNSKDNEIEEINYTDIEYVCDRYMVLNNRQEYFNEEITIWYPTDEEG
jgi:hypothetical protein